MSPYIISETNEYFVICKPPFIAVEPPSHAPTLRDWMLENGHIKAGDWKEENRYGVVHRIDTDTSGIVIWAKSVEAQEKLKLLWQGRSVKKTYTALVIGECNASGTIELPIIRDNKQDKQKVSFLNEPNARPALTEYERLQVGSVQNERVSLVSVHPITGRTHQIRVHFKAINHPLIADKLYGEKRTDQVAKALDLNRQFLHASEIEIEGNKFECPLSEDLVASLQKVSLD